jgi:hypothetical protein
VVDATLTVSVNVPVAFERPPCELLHGRNDLLGPFPD